MTQKQLEINKRLNKHKTWLHRWSILAMISTALTLQIHSLERFPSICKYADVLSLSCFVFGKCCATLHRVSRLQYYFRINRAISHSNKKEGFKKRVFIIENCNGVFSTLLLMYTIIDLLFFAEWEYLDSYNGCYARDTGYFHEKFRRNFVYPFAVINYVLWDWMVLVKIIKFYIAQKKQNMDINESISFKLYKIAFSTLIMELSSVIAFIGTNLYIRDIDNYNLMMVVTVFTILDIVVSVYMVFLMIDHNHNEYVKFITVLNNFGLFCCCDRFVQIAISGILVMRKLWKGSIGYSPTRYKAG